MSEPGSPARWVRRAQPWLGTLVEVGLSARQSDRNRAFEAAFAAMREGQRSMSRFDPGSDVSRFNASPAGSRLTIQPATRRVLALAATLRDATQGGFDVSLGSAAQGWQLCGSELRKLDAAARLDLAGIAKGAIVDAAIDALVANGCDAGWVNAGGDLRAFGEIEIPVRLRAAHGGGVHAFATLCDGAMATSQFGPAVRSMLSGAAADAPGTYVSVAAPQCMWADALTKVVALSADPQHSLLGQFGASAWLH